MLIRLMALGLLLPPTLVLAQGPVSPLQPKQAESEDIPVALALQDIAGAYSSAPTAEIVTVKATLRTMDRNESLTQSYVIRIDPDPQAGSIRQVLLELGPLRAWFGAGSLLVTSTAAPEKYFEASYTPPLTTDVLASLLPPVPAPQIAFATGAGQPMDVTPYSPSVVFAKAVAFTRVRPQVMTLTGASPVGPVSLTAEVQSARILRFTCEAASPQPSLIELTCRSVDPGDPATWRPQMETRKRVVSLSELTPSPPAPLKVGERAPEISLSRPEVGVWSLRQALAATPPRDVAMVVWRWSGDPETAKAAARDAAAGLAALQSFDTQSPEADLLLVPAVVIELGEYSGAALNAAAGTWVEVRGPGAEERTLLWSNSSARSIEPFSAGSNALAVVVAPDRVIKAIIPLDGAAADSDLTEKVRASLSPAARGPAPQPEESAPPGSP